jgi:flagellar export protein FliJ
MNRFRFSLEAVRTLRLRNEQEALQHYASALRGRQSALAALNDAQRDCEAAWELRRERTREGAPAAHLAQVQDYCVAMEAYKKQCEDALAAAMRVVEQKLEKLHKDRQAREVVDKLCERQRERHEREMQRENQKRMDDLAQRSSSRLISAGPTRWWN